MITRVLRRFVQLLNLSARHLASFSHRLIDLDWPAFVQSKYRPRQLSLERLEPRFALDGAGGAGGEQYLFGAELFADVSQTTSGLVGTYIDQSLIDRSPVSDWRTTQQVAGTRVDSPLEFLSDDWGSRSAVGLTGGSDNDWERFSVQWDGYLNITQAGQRIATVSDDGSRMWIDLNHNDTFEENELLDNGWGRGQGPTTGERSAGLAAGVYAIRIQYYELGGGNVFTLATSPYVPQAFVPTATNPRQVVRVLALDFDPRVPSEGNRRMHEVFNWSDPRRMATQFERDLEWGTGGAIDIQLVDWRELDAFPTFTDGFRYNADDYVQHRRQGSGWHESGTDFDALVDDQGLVPLVNSGAIDEIWMFGDHYFNLLGEAWMAGPNSFFINGPSFPDVGFNRAIAGYGFNYERGVAEMVHNLGHRTENHGQRAFGAWNLANPVTAWDRFTSNYLETTTGPYGVGSTHVPANADAQYDYGNSRIVNSTAADFANYPNETGATTAVGRQTWAMGPYPDYQRDYLNWYFAMMPRNDGNATDGRAANWFKYIWDFNSYEEGTGLPRREDAFGSGPILRKADGMTYDLTVRYYDDKSIDVTTLDVEDIRIIGPSGASFNVSPIGPGVVTNTTAGTARTVTYRLTAPGGSWDFGDNGDYRIVVQANQVRDIDGNAVPAGDVGMFRIAVPDPTMINVRALLAAGAASLTHTPFDIGIPEHLFDGVTSTLVRTPNIDPAVITLSFQNPQTVTGMQQYFSHADGDPAFRYSIEAADSLSDLDNRTGSFHELVSRQQTAGDQFSNITFGHPSTATIFRLTVERLTGDDYVHLNEWRLLGNGIREFDPPTASLQTVAVPQKGESAQFLHVAYTDATGVRVPSIDNGDLLVTDPSGITISPVFYDVDQYLDGTSRTATYWFSAPGGQWDYTDNGTYTVQLRPEAVRDVLLNTSASAMTLGTFLVDLRAPQTVFPSDVAELNATDWKASADDATASANDDSSRKLAGQSSIRFDTTGGFDTSLRLPASGAEDWNLSRASQLHFQLYAENPSSYGFQEGPWVRLYGVDGGYFEYRYYENGNPAIPINDARDQWKLFELPLNPAESLTGWHRTVSGSPSLQHVGSIEFHADTWDSGFTFWLDDVGVDQWAWQNPTLSNDVDGDGNVAPIDVLIIINELNSRRFIDSSGRFFGAPVGPHFYFDVSGDNFTSAIDALLIINALNSVASAEGENVRHHSELTAFEFALADDRLLSGVPSVKRENLAASGDRGAEKRNRLIPVVPTGSLPATHPLGFGQSTTYGDERSELTRVVARSIQHTQHDTNQTTNSRDGGQRAIYEAVALKRAGESGTETPQAKSHREAESVTQTPPMTRRVFGDQAVIDRLVHEMDQG